MLTHWGIIYCTTEISYYFPPIIRRRQEHEADEFAAHFLVPEEELQKMKGLSIEELSEYFGVPEEMVELRLKL